MIIDYANKNVTGKRKDLNDMSVGSTWRWLALVTSMNILDMSTKKTKEVLLRENILGVGLLIIECNLWNVPQEIFV